MPISCFLYKFFSFIHKKCFTYNYLYRNKNTKIKNKREHAQERLNKTQDELNYTLKRLEKYSFAIGQIKNMSFVDRLFNRLPEEIKELQPGKEEETD